MPWTPVLMVPKQETRWQDDPEFAAQVYAIHAQREKEHVVMLVVTAADGKKVGACAHSALEAWLAMLDHLKALPDSNEFRTSLVQSWEQRHEEEYKGLPSKMRMDAWEMFWKGLQRKYPVGQPLQSLHVLDRGF